MKRELTASVYTVEEQRILLILHKKLGKWLPPGGHVDPDELPHEAAIREVKEETGLEVELMQQENLWIPQKINGRSIPRPYLNLLFEIPKYKDINAHQHIDFVYIGRVIGGALVQNREETDGIRWFTLDDLQKEEEIFEETLTVCSHILKECFHLV
ncbi:MAG: hypothetical protein S4CHLAM45_13870 [Chlamydiales bacterium]|nr:hypothetical protein [Chlamydiales bacterium]MCH9620492.1 hypothetical protein [Chlamydiales bacterium]MCH9623477.1 hypothetical protein [Chlamydiales bacterium]